MAKRSSKNIIFIVIILALIGYILYDKGVFANIDFSKNKEQVFVPEETTDKVVAENKSTDVVPTTEDNVLSKQEACEIETLKEVTSKDTKYVKGAILISFTADVSFSKAKNIIEDLNYSIQNEASVKTKFETGQKWFVANVGVGNEFRAICTLKEDSNVKYVFIEPLLEIHE